MESPSSVGASKVKKATDFFPDYAHVSDALRTILARLDASEPTLLYEKRMPLSDRAKDQNRLLISGRCKNKIAAFATIFTETEMSLVHRPKPLEEEDEKHDSKDDKGNENKNKDGGGGEDDDDNNKVCCGSDDDDDNDGGDKRGDADKDGDQRNKQKSKVQGLDVQAYDCDGRAYKLNLKFLSCTTGYRIIGPDYRVFLENNGLLLDGGRCVKRSGHRRRKKRRSSLRDEEQPPTMRDAVAAENIWMELWAFRSPKLSIGQKDQPGGALGLLLLHHRRGEVAQGQVRVGGMMEVHVVAAPQEPEVVVDVEQPHPRQNSHGGGTATQGEDMVAAMEVQVVVAPQEPEIVVVDVEQPQPRQNSHGSGTATWGEDMVVAGDCARDAAPAVDGVAGDKLDDAAMRSTRDRTLSPLERLLAVLLSLHGPFADDGEANANDNGVADANDNGEADANDEQGPS